MRYRLNDRPHSPKVIARRVGTAAFALVAMAGVGAALAAGHRAYGFAHRRGVDPMWLDWTALFSTLALGGLLVAVAGSRIFLRLIARPEFKELYARVAVQQGSLPPPPPSAPGPVPTRDGPRRPGPLRARAEPPNE